MALSVPQKISPSIIALPLLVCGSAATIIKRTVNSKYNTYPGIRFHRSISSSSSLSPNLFYLISNPTFLSFAPQRLPSRSSWLRRDWRHFDFRICASSSSAIVTKPGGIKVTLVPTKPIKRKKTGTSGLRKKVKVFKEENYLANWIKESPASQYLSNLSCGNMWGMTMVEMMANMTYPINATSTDMLTLLKTRFNFRKFYGYHLYRYWHFASEENDHVRFFPLMLVSSHREHLRNNEKANVEITTSETIEIVHQVPRENEALTSSSSSSSSLVIPPPQTGQNTECMVVKFYELKENVGVGPEQETHDKHYGIDFNAVPSKTIMLFGQECTYVYNNDTHVQDKTEDIPNNVLVDN
ncbi:hypothetical protein Sjap_008991 [Stephania japonica]|uniref:Uncharacterized protein n=1 Tax=Stephania japonica TaxID=461633 RepID=A0AAP0PBW5_9MAGN